MNKTLKENMIRNMAGVSAYTSREKAVKAIISKYPTPQKFSKALLKISMEKGIDAKVKAKAQSLAATCSKLDQDSYPQFVSKVVGLSKFWKICGATIAIGAVTAATTWLVTLCVRASNDISEYNKQHNVSKLGAKEFGDRFVTHAKRDIEDAGDAVTGAYTKVKRLANNDPTLGIEKSYHKLTRDDDAGIFSSDFWKDKWTDTKHFGRQTAKDIKNWYYDKMDAGQDALKNARRSREDALYYDGKTLGNVNQKIHNVMAANRGHSIVGY